MHRHAPDRGHSKQGVGLLEPLGLRVRLRLPLGAQWLLLRSRPNQYKTCRGARRAGTTRRYITRSSLLPAAALSSATCKETAGEADCLLTTWCNGLDVTAEVTRSPSPNTAHPSAS